MTRNRLIIVFCLLVQVFLPELAISHDLGIARVSLMQDGRTQYRIEAKLPLVDTPPAPIFPSRFEVSQEPDAVIPDGVVALYSWSARTSAEPLETSDVILLPWARDGAFVTATWMDGSSSGHFFRLGAGGTTIDVGRLGGAPPPFLDTVGRYGWLGIEHILSGWDHLAFVLAICLLCKGWSLLKLVTAFTLGHSVTLGAAFVGWVNVPSPPVEASIALSIALVAALAVAREPEFTHGFWIVFGFGLLHGLGFAGALAEVGIPRSELISGLLSFNLGVELGQLAFVALIVLVVSMAVLVFAKLKRTTPVMFRQGVAVGLVVLGGFWTVQRVLGFAG